MLKIVHVKRVGLSRAFCKAGSCLGFECSFAFDSRQSWTACFVDSLLHFLRGRGGGWIILRLASILSSGIRNTLGRFLLQQSGISAGLIGQLAYADLTLTFKARNLFNVTKNLGANKLICKIYLIAKAL